MVIRQDSIKISDEKIESLNKEYHSRIQSIYSTTLCAITKVMDNNHNLPSSFDISYPISNNVYEIIKDVLSDLGIAPIQIRSVFKRGYHLYHVDLAL